MTKVLLLGGTGAIGKHLQKHCINLGYQVFTTTRSQRIYDSTENTYIYGDALDDIFVRNLIISGFDVIIDFMVYRTKHFYNRLNFLLPNTRHYIFLSSYRVYAESSNKLIEENTPRLLDISSDKQYLKTDEYALAKARQEDYLYASSHRNWTIVRPSITYAANRLQFGCLEALSFLPRAYVGLNVPLADTLFDKSTTLTWAGDVARMICGLLLQKKAMTETYNVCTNEHRTWSEIGDIYQKCLELKIQTVTTEQYLSLGVNPYQFKYDRMLNRICDNTKILQFTGLKQEQLTKVEYGLASAVKSSKLAFNTVSRMQARMDFLSGRNRLRDAIATKSMKSVLAYLVGHTEITNKMTLSWLNRKFAPPYQKPITPSLPL